MDNKENIQESTEQFALEDILQEFASDNPEADLAAYAEAEAEAMLDAPSEEKDPSMEDTIRLDNVRALTEQLRNEAAALQEMPEGDLNATQKIPGEALEEALAEAETAPEEKAYVLTSEQIPAPKPILFRSKLGDLKRKLVSGPEKRYYDLTEIGLGRVQIAIFLCFLIVVACAGGTALYSMSAVLPNRMRLLIFSQVLAMMVSALLGCYVLMDGILDLVTGKFSLNSMLFLTLAACAADAVFCLQELRVPCCAAFSLEMTFALWNRSLRRSTEIGQMDTLRKATILDGLVKVPEYFGSRPGILRTEGRVEDFMDNYNARTAPEKALSIYALLAVLVSVIIAVVAGMRHSLSMGLQVLSTSMLVATPASAFISQSRPAAILERRLHMVGTVICGWKGVQTLCGKASFPVNDRDLFPLGAIKLNGVKFFGEREPEDVIACAAALMRENGGGLEPVFTQLLKSRGGPMLAVEELTLYPSGGVGGVMGGETMLMGTAKFLQEQGVTIPDDAMIHQAVYFAVEQTLTAVFALQFSRTKASAGGLVTLGSCRKIRPLVLSNNFLLTPELIKEKFKVRTKRIDFPQRDVRRELEEIQPSEELIAAALVTQRNLSSAAYAVTGAKTLRSTCRVGMVLHIVAGVVGILIMYALAYLGELELLSPLNILMYQVVWMLPAILITEWTRTV